MFFVNFCGPIFIQMSKFQETWKIVIIYALFGCSWIYFSDSALAWFFQDQEIITKISIFKGFLFIICTSILLFFLIARLSGKIKKSTKALQESENLLSFLLKHSSDSLVIINADGSQRYVSPGAQRITGFSISELEGRGLDSLIHPLDLKDVMAAWNEAVEHPEKTVTVQYRHIHKTREWVYSEAIAQSFLAEPAINGVIASVRDITAHKRREEEHTSHIRFLESLELVDRVIKQETDVEQMLWNMVNTVFLIFNCDRAWLLYPCNPKAPSFRVPVEITKPEYPGAKFLNIDVPMSPGEAENMREALVSDSPVTYTDGTERPVATAKIFGVQSQMFMPIFPKLGDPWVFGMHQCSHARIWTEEEKKLLKEIGRRISDGLSSALYLRELQENEERFRATFEQAAVGIAHVAPDGRWIRVNQKLCDIVGYNKEELLKKTFQEITYYEDLDADLGHFRQMLAGEIQTYSMEMRYLHKDGSIIWTNLTISIVRHTLHDPAYFISVIEDISERKRAEAEKVKLEDQLQQAQKLEAIGQLAGGVAHDFNNMLSVILGHSELAMQQIGPDRPLYNDLEEIRKAAVRSADITRQLLAFARKQTVAPKVIDLNDTIEGMLKMLRRLIGENIDLVWLPGADLWPVKIDPSQIDQILANLCVNARAAIAGVGKVTVETGNDTFNEEYCEAHAGFISGDYVRIALGDSGSGMDKETLAHIFEPFFTTKGVGEGTGLGLATVYGAIKQNNGFINASSEPGRGTLFTIYLPRHVSEKGQVPVKNVGESALIGHETILLVEDELMILQMTRLMLQLLGYTVLVAGTPREAINLVGEFPGEIHLLLTDVIMPEMNGRDLVENLLPTYPQLKCLFMSGYTSDIITQQGILDEGVQFLQKPFSRSELATKVRMVLEKN